MDKSCEEVAEGALRDADGVLWTYRDLWNGRLCVKDERLVRALILRRLYVKFI